MVRNRCLYIVRAGDSASLEKLLGRVLGNDSMVECSSSIIIRGEGRMPTTTRPITNFRQMGVTQSTAGKCVA